MTIVQARTLEGKRVAVVVFEHGMDIAIAQKVAEYIGKKCNASYLRIKDGEPDCYITWNYTKRGWMMNPHGA